MHNYEHEPLDIDEMIVDAEYEELTNDNTAIAEYNVNTDISEYKETVAPESEGIHKDLKQDYRRVRDTYYDIIEKGQDALENLLEIAASSEHPRAYEVSAQIMKTISDTNDKIIGLHDQLRRIKEKDQEIENQKNGGNTVNNNSVFVGSMNEFQQFLKKMKNKSVTTEFKEEE